MNFRPVSERKRLEYKYTKLSNDLGSPICEATSLLTKPFDLYRS
jgi:hypothetical protein